jgi:hypothetical protein
MLIFSRLRSGMLEALLLSGFLLGPAGGRCAAFQDGQQEAGDAPQTYTLVGTVVNAITGEPVRRALVEVRSASVLADAQGHFEIQGLPAGKVGISARKPGFFSEQEFAQDGSGAPQRPMVEIGADAPPAVVKLYPEGVISGRVTSNGEALEDVAVRVLKLNVSNGTRHWEPLGNGSTGEDGSFRVANLMPGVYYLVAGPHDLPSFAASGKSAVPEFGYPEALFPGVSDVHAATPIVLSAGQEAQADFALPAERVYRVSGIVSGYAPDQGVELQIINGLGDRLPVPLDFDPATGKFQSKIPAGSYVLRGQAYLEDKLRQGEVPLTVNSELSGVHIALSPSLPVPVEVKLQRTRPGRGNENFAPLGFHLQSIGLPLDSSDVYADVDPKERKLELNNVQPGTYSAEIIPNSPWYVQSATCGDVDLLSQDLKFSPGSPLPAISVVLRDDGAELSVKVSGLEGAATVSVLAVPVGKPRMAKMQTAYNGAAQFRMLAPGDYDVAAVANAGDLEYTNPEAVEPYLTQASRVTLQPNNSKNIGVEVTEVGK